MGQIVSVTLDDLRVFVAVCEIGNLSAVARSLACSQPAVAQHVKRLETELGLALFERQPRGVSPTAAGLVLQQAAVEGLVGLDAARRQIEEIRRGQSGPLRVITGGTTIRHFMAEAIAAFPQHHPNASLDLRTAYSTRVCIEALLGGRADLAFVTLNPGLIGVEQRRAVAVPWRLVVPHGDPLGRRRRVGVGDLASLRYIALPASSASRQQMEAHLAELGVQLQPTTVAGDWDTAVLLVELGLGQAIVPAIHAHNLANGSKLVSVEITGVPPIVFGWAARRWTLLSPLALEFAATVSDNLAPWEAV